MPGSIEEGSGAVLDASWTSLGWLLAAFGRVLNPLGRFSGGSWALLGVTWLVKGNFLTPQTALGLKFEGFGSVPS